MILTCDNEYFRRFGRRARSLILRRDLLKVMNISLTNQTNRIRRATATIHIFLGVDDVARAIFWARLQTMCRQARAQVASWRALWAAVDYQSKSNHKSAPKKIPVNTLQRRSDRDFLGTFIIDDTAEGDCRILGTPAQILRPDVDCGVLNVHQRRKNTSHVRGIAKTSKVL